MDEQKNISYEQAQKLAQTISKQHNIKSHADWIRLMGGIPRKDFLSFGEARAFARESKAKSVAEWVEIAEELALANLEGRLDGYKIPSRPAKYYKNEWTSWGDFLGTGHKVPARFRPFEDAVIYARNLGIKNCKEWQQYCDIEDRPKDIPHSPQKIYKDEWQGWNHFFGTGLYRQEFYIETPDEELLEEIDRDIEWDIENVLGLLEAFREQYETDEEIIEMLKNEPQMFVKGMINSLKKYPRE